MPVQLKPIAHSNKALSRLNAALNIYRSTILPEAQNPERQILYWIDHANDEVTDEFRCYAFQKGASVVGYLQYSYFREENLFFFEYLCLTDRTDRGLVPSSATKVIEEHLATNYPPDFMIAFEVARKHSDSGWIADDRLIRYFRRLGFRTVDFDYRYPILQSYDGASSYPADLMVRMPSARSSITASELRTVLRCIYFKHYLRWDRPFLSREKFSERERLISALYSEQVNTIGGNDSFGTAGDAKRATIQLFAQRHPRVSALLDRIFGPKLPRLLVVMFLVLGTQKVLGSGWLLLLFVPAVTAIYCLAEDTDASRKLVTVIMARFKPVPQQLPPSPRSASGP